MYRLARALLFSLPPETAHRLTMRALSAWGTSPASCAQRRERTLPSAAEATRLRTDLCGLPLEHPIALAAGLDKDAEAVTGLFALGFSAIEVGTLTPRPQPGNPTPRLFRLPEHRALINRLGFNNHGAAAAAGRLSALTWRPGPVGANVGKNRDTPLESAADDYVAAAEVLAPVADYFVVNASSPNTPGLRDLQAPKTLAALLTRVRRGLDETGGKGKPLLLKIAPDLDAHAIDDIVDVALDTGASGLICTNTTLERPIAHSLAQETGGLSGPPLREKSTGVLRQAYSRARGRLPLVGCGGITSAEDVYEKLRAGATCVQVYTGFIYGGPSFVGTLVKNLGRLLRERGHASISSAVGAGA
ncbi:MAG: quinone-dependent dihydroorotate dehydrogenase [Myxococcaceae bacterium]